MALFKRIKTKLAAILCASVFSAFLLGSCSNSINPQNFLCEDDRYLSNFHLQAAKNAAGGTAGLAYFEYSGTVAVAVGTAVASDIVIPSTYNGLPVTAVMTDGFMYSSFLKTISFENQAAITIIGSQAFAHCVALTSFSLPSNVTKINPSAFAFCSSLSEVAFESGSKLTDFGTSCFMGCAALKDFSALPSHLASVGESAFQGCLSLTRIIFPNVTILGNDGTDAGAGTITIKKFAFTNCEKMGMIYFSSSVSVCEDYAFLGCERGFAFFSGGVPTGFSENWRLAYSDSSDIYRYIGYLTNSSDIAYNGDGYYYSKNLSSDPSLDYDVIIRLYNRTNPTIEAAGSVDEIVPNIIVDSDGTHKVVAVGAQAFLDHSELNSVTIGSNMKLIKNGGFKGCSNLTNINLDGATSLAKLENYAFDPSSSDGTIRSNPKLKSISIPAAMEEIGYCAFSGYPYLESLVFQGATDNTSKLNKIVSSAFYAAGASAYTDSVLPTCELILPASLTSIDSYSFQYCTFIRKITFADDPNGAESITKIGVGAFSGITYLSELNLSKHVGIIGANAFSYKLDTSGTTRGGGFLNAVSLYSVVIPSTVTQIDDYAFNLRTKLSIYFAGTAFPTTRSSNWNRGQGGYNSGTTNSYTANMTIPGSYAGNVTNDNKNVGNMSYMNVVEVGEIDGTTQPDTASYTSKRRLFHYVSANGDFDFVETGNNSKQFILSRYRFVPDMQAKNRDAVIPQYLDPSNTLKVVALGRGAFNNSSLYSDYNQDMNVGLSTVYIPDSVVNIGDYCFTGCYGLTAVKGGASSTEGVFSTNLKNIGNCGFASTGLVKASFSSTLQRLWSNDTSDDKRRSNYAFRDTPRLYQLSVDAACTAYQTDNNILYTVSGTVLTMFAAATAYDFPPDGYLDVQPDASYTSLVLIKEAFKDSGGLKKLKLPEICTAIPDSFCENADLLTTVIVPTSLESIGASAFKGCATLSSFSGVGQTAAAGLVSFVGTNISSVGSRAFNNNPAVTDVDLRSNGTLTSLPLNAFSSCWNIKNVTFNDDIISLGQNCFSHSSRLQAINLPLGIEDIGSRAFYDCPKVTTLSIPEYVSIIRSGAFYGLKALTSLSFANVEAFTPLVIQDRVFANNAANRVLMPTNTSFTSVGTNGAFLDASGMLEGAATGSGVYLMCTGADYDTEQNKGTSGRYPMEWNYVSASKYTDVYVYYGDGSALSQKTGIKYWKWTSDTGPKTLDNITIVNV